MSLPTPEQAREIFLRDGAIILRHFFSKEELHDVNAALDELMKNAPATADHYRPDNWKKFDTNPQQLGEQAKNHPAFIALKQHSRFVEMTSSLIGNDFEQEDYLLVQVTPKGTGQAWHQDSVPKNPSIFMMNRLIYPRDVDPASGQVMFVPGSHKHGIIPPGGPQEAMEGEVAVTPEAGTLLFLHSHCYHRVTKNQTENPRASINYRVRPHGVPSGEGRIAAFRTGTYDFGTNQAVNYPDGNK